MSETKIVHKFKESDLYFYAVQEDDNDDFDEKLSRRWGGEYSRIKFTGWGPTHFLASPAVNYSPNPSCNFTCSHKREVWLVRATVHFGDIVWEKM